jgi:eukaryotic-like serine/threonine-protein kinase
MEGEGLELDRPGVVLDERYALLEQLTSDELATCWVAEDRSLRRRVVIRLLHPTLRHAPQAAGRFRHEAIAAAAVDHAHVACQYAVELREELAYTVSEYVDGPSLAQLLARHGALGPDAAAALAYQAAAGLAAIHAHGIVHRDVGPSTLWLGPHGRVRLVDYRRASLPGVGVQGARDLRVDEDRAVHAPEVIQDSEATAASDVFALGRSIHVAWHGYRRVELRQDRLASFRGLLGGGQREARRRVLVGLVLAAAHPDPGQRPTAQEVAERLEAHCGGTSEIVLEPFARGRGRR